MTLLYFPVCVILAWIADRRLLFYKYMGKRYRADKRRGIVVETEGDLTPNKGGMEMIIDGKFPPRGGAVVPAENCGGGTQDGAAANNIGAAAGATATGAGGNLPTSNSTMVNVESSKELDESRKEVRHQRKYSLATNWQLTRVSCQSTPARSAECILSSLLKVIRILKELKQKNPDKELDQLLELANYYALLHQQKSRAFYRIQVQHTAPTHNQQLVPEMNT